MNDDENVIKLLNEDGQEEEFEVLATFAVEEDEYAALLPLEGEEVYLLKLVYDENEELILMNIEDQDEFTNVAAAYETIADEIIDN